MSNNILIWYVYLNFYSRCTFNCRCLFKSSIISSDSQIPNTTIMPPPIKYFVATMVDLDKIRVQVTVKGPDVIYLHDYIQVPISRHVYIYILYHILFRLCIYGLYKRYTTFFELLYLCTSRLQVGELYQMRNVRCIPFQHKFLNNMCNFEVILETVDHIFYRGDDNSEHFYNIHCHDVSQLCVNSATINRTSKQTFNIH